MNLLKMDLFYFAGLQREFSDSSCRPRSENLKTRQTAVLGPPSTPLPTRQIRVSMGGGLCKQRQCWALCSNVHSSHHMQLLFSSLFQKFSSHVAALFITLLKALISCSSSFLTLLETSFLFRSWHYMQQNFSSFSSLTN